MAWTLQQIRKVQEKLSRLPLHIRKHEPTIPLLRVCHTSWNETGEENKVKHSIVWKKIIYKCISKHDIHNALTEPYMPLSDEIHGPYKMTPPELLHISGSGLIMYMFQSLKLSIAPAQKVLIDSLNQKNITGLYETKRERYYKGICQERSARRDKMSVVGASREPVSLDVCCTHRRRSCSLGRLYRYV